MLEQGRRGRDSGFVDREASFAVFRAECARSVHAPRILNIVGVGGVGKSRLLAEMQRTTEPPVRTAVVDFEVPGLGQREPVLIHLREQFHQQGVRFDSFDIAYAVLWQRLHPHLRISAATLPLAAESEILSEILADVGKLPLVAGAVGLLRLADRLRIDVQRRRRIRGDRALQRLDDLSTPGRLGELSQLVAEIFARELCEASVDVPFVIFLDGYESLVPEPVRKGRVAAIDSWLRGLLAPLDRGLVVVAGRERLNWAQHDAEWGTRTVVDELSSLPDDARLTFLADAGVTDPDHRRTIAAESQGLPFYLQLAVEAGGSAGGVAGRTVSPDAILERFLRHVGPDAEAVLEWLGVPRVLDYPVFRTLTRSFDLPSNRRVWDVLCAYVFVQEVGPGLIRLHDVMATALRANLSGEDTEAVHACLAKAWAARADGIGDPAGTHAATPLVAVGEAVFHGLHAGSLSAERLLHYADQAVLIGGKQAAGGMLQDLRAHLDAGTAAGGPDGLPDLVRCLEGEAAILVGDTGAALRVTDGPIPDPATVIGARLAVVRGEALRIPGRTTEALAMYSDVWDRHSGDVRLKAGLAAADLHMCQGRFTDADELAGRIESLCGAEGREMRGHVARPRHLARRMAFDFAESADWLARAQQEYEAAGSFVGLANVRTNHVEQYAFTDPGTAVALAPDVITLHQESGTLHELGKAWTALGVARIHLGELAAADAALTEARAVLDRARYRSGGARAELFHGVLRLRRGDHGGAELAARGALRELAGTEVYPTLILLACALLERMGTDDELSRRETVRARAAITAADPAGAIEARMHDVLTRMTGAAV